MAQVCYTELSKETRIQLQLNDVAARMPLHVLAEYLETLQLEFRELPERIQRLQFAIEVEQQNLSYQKGTDNSLKMKLEALQKELREMPVYIRRVQKAIEARQKQFSDGELVVHHCGNGGL